MTATKRLVAVWAALLLLTFGSFAVGIEQSERLSAAATVVIIAVAMLKVRLIGLHFMDIRVAPLALRLIFEGYVLVVFVALAALALPLGF
jgi:hypothetical protein